MTKILRYWPHVVVVLVAAMAAPIGIQILLIQLRLSRNGAVAAELVESLQTRFPKASFRGAASYERERIYLTVIGGIDEKEWPELERCLRDQKQLRAMSAEIWLFTSVDEDFPRHKI